jgi:hemolysin activation/secretion protein
MANFYLRLSGTVALCLALASAVSAQTPASNARFDIQGYAVEGSPLLSSDDFSRLMSPFIGKQKSAVDIQKAQQALQQAYLVLGHCSVQVTVPNMHPEGGTVTLNLVQSPTPVSKDCLPMVALGEKREAPSLSAPGTGLKPQSTPVPGVAQAALVTPVVRPPAVIVRAPVSDPAIESVKPAEPAATSGALKFDIERYVVEGNTLLKPNAIGDVLRRYTGKQKDFADVQRALEALQAAYQAAGWGVVQVTLPEQELERGEVRFEVIEIRLGKIEVQGNENFSTSNVLRSVPSLKPGTTPNSTEIARSLKVANENPAKQSQVSLKSGSQDGEVDAAIKVVDENPRKYSIGLDNTGTSSTGVYRLGFGFQHSNLWGRDHQLSLQYITDPEHPSKVTVLGLGYHIPLYARGDSIDVILGYSDVDSGTLNQLYIDRKSVV